jgi:hypothetical protein
LPLTKRELDAIDSSFSIFISLSKLPAFIAGGDATRESRRCAELESLIQIKTQSGHESASLYREYFLGARREGTMSRRRKSSYQSASEYNAYLAGWAFAFAVVLVTFMLMANGVYF